MTKRLLGLLAMFAFVGGSHADTPPTVKKGLGAPGYLNGTARMLLKKRMERHGKDMLLLTQAVVLLDRDAAKRLATQVAEEPRLTRPIAGGEDDLNTSLPERFFVLQDELRVKAKAVAEATTKADDVALAARTGELIQTCVTCHSTYLEPNKE
jgi:hypothetical protein